MNYRHIYHAGNFADVIKHIIMRNVFTHLQQKDGAVFALDAFAGLGRYDLNSEQANKTAEYKNGIAKLMGVKFASPDITAYQNMVKGYWKQNRYAGSPLLLASLLRKHDRLIANELHKEDYRTLKNFMDFYPNVQTTQKDAYESIRAFLPPKNARAMVVVDPPFERKDEFEILTQQIPVWLKKCATATILIWYPIKAHLDDAHMIETCREVAAEHALSRVYKCEFLQHERHQENTFNGCGVLVLNAPWNLYTSVEALSKPLCDALGFGEIHHEWLVNI